MWQPNSIPTIANPAAAQAYPSRQAIARQGPRQTPDPPRPGRPRNPPAAHASATRNDRGRSDSPYNHLI